MRIKPTSSCNTYKKRIFLLIIITIIIRPLRSRWNIGPPLMLAIWLYFEQRLASGQVSPFPSTCNILVSLQVYSGLPLRRFPCGVSKAVLARCLSGLLGVWPVHSHVRSFISSCIGCCPDCPHSFSFWILLLFFRAPWVL